MLKPAWLLKLKHPDNEMKIRAAEVPAEGTPGDITGIYLPAELTDGLGTVTVQSHLLTAAFLMFVGIPPWSGDGSQAHSSEAQ